MNRFSRDLAREWGKNLGRASSAGRCRCRGIEHGHNEIHPIRLLRKNLDSDSARRKPRIG